MIIGNYLKCNKKVLIVEKRRSKNKPALEVQRLPTLQDLITASTTSKFTIYPFHIPHIYIYIYIYIIKILGKLNKFPIM